MIVPEHSHNFEIPTATKQDILAGKATDKVVVPALLGSAATANSSDFATASQGVKADNAVPAARFVHAGFGLIGGGVLTQDITIELNKMEIQSYIDSQIASKIQKILPQDKEMEPVSQK